MSETNQIIRDDETYYAIKDRLSPSGLKFLNIHPRAYQEYLTKGVEHSIHIDKGKLYHALLNEPHMVEKLYTFLPKDKLPFPDKDFRVKANREYRDEFLEKHKDKTVFDKEEDYENAVNLTKEIHRNPIIKNLLDGCEAEVGMTWEHFETGVPLKGKTDVFKSQKKGRSFLLDIKKLPEITPKKVRGYLQDRFIHSQLAVYADGLREHGLCDPDDFYILAIQDKPADYAIYRVNEFIEDGYDEFIRLAFLYKNCVDSGIWSGYEMYGDDNGIIDLAPYGRKDVA
jgi:hypothetical protein